MNESMLTGESVPVTKTALLKASSEDVVYCNKAHEKSSLKCGTMVIQTRKAGQELVTAVVIRFLHIFVILLHKKSLPGPVT